MHIERIGSQNHLKEIEMIKNISGESWKYEEIFRFLEVLQTLYDFLPEGSEQKSIYDDIVDFIEILWISWNKVQVIFLAHIRILKKLGSLREISFMWESQSQYIFIYIDKKSMKSVLSGKTLDISTINRFEKAISESRYYGLL